jgi:peptidoglycan/LPS O-acetylase OafA/YrhL
LFHMIVFTQLTRMFRMEWWGERLLSIPVVLVFCYLAYRMIEQPSHKISRMLYARLSRRSDMLLRRIHRNVLNDSSNIDECITKAMVEK